MELIMNKIIKNEILGKPIFSKIFSIIVENTLYMCRGGNKSNKLVLGARQTKIRLLGLALMLCMASLVIDCANKTTEAVTPTPPSSNLVLNISSIEMYASPGSYTFTINTDQNWEITNIPPWLNVSPKNGSAGAANLVTLTTLGINSVSVINDSLNINVPSAPSLNKTLKLTRNFYKYCVGGYGLSGPSTVIVKWLSVGNAVGNLEDTTNATNGYNHPNSRILVGIAKGCDGTGGDQVKVKDMSGFRLDFYSNVSPFPSFTVSENVNFTNSPFTSVITTTVSGYTNLKLTIRDPISSNVLLVSLVQQGPGTVNDLSHCTSPTTYFERDLSEDSGAGTCKDTSAFPTTLKPLKDSMNALIRSANPAYVFP